MSAQAQVSDLRRRILEAAAEQIAQRGYHGMSMRDLARATGRQPSSLYHYFPGKEEILFALQREAFEALIASAQQTVSGAPDAVSGLYLFIAHHLRYVADNGDVMRVLVHEAASLEAQHRSQVRVLKERYFLLGRRLLAAAIVEGCHDTPGGEMDTAELERLTYTLFGALNWVYGWYDARLHGAPQDLARTIHRLVLCGVIARCPYQPLHARLESRFAATSPAPLLGDGPSLGDLS